MRVPVHSTDRTCAVTHRTSEVRDAGAVTTASAHRTAARALRAAPFAVPVTDRCRAANSPRLHDLSTARAPLPRSIRRRHEPVARWSGRRLAAYLTQPIGRASVTTSDPGALAATLQPGDVLLVDGNTRISRMIRTLTQSTWSHAALCVTAAARATDRLPRLLEADVKVGVREVSLALYAAAHTRICRPVGLHGDDLQRVLRHARNRLGHRYDPKNVFDLARYLLPAPPVPRRWRRRLLALGSGDPTRAIC